MESAQESPRCFTKINKIAIFIFFSLNVSIMFIDGFPDRSAFGAKYMRFIARYQALSMLYQPWSMFAPNPMNTNAFVEADIYYTDGSKENWPFPKQTSFDGLKRTLVGDRYRIFGQETLVPNENELIWMDVGKYITKQITERENISNKRIVKEIIFKRYYNKIIPPPEGDFRPHGTFSTFYNAEPVFQYQPELEKTSWN